MNSAFKIVEWYRFTNKHNLAFLQEASKEPSHVLQGFSQFSEAIWYLTKTVLGLSKQLSKQHRDADS